MPGPDPHLSALIKLLGDDHPQVIEAARTKLIEMGDQVVSLLKEVADRHEDPKTRVEAKEVLERIRLAAVNREWERLGTLPDEKLDLEAGVFLLAKVSYPDLDPVPYQQRLDELAERIRPHLKTVVHPQDRLIIINRLLFKDEGFRGNWEDYFDPENSYLNRVLDRKLGIPISLSVLYLLVVQRLQLPIQGAGLPGHFMVKYEDDQTELYVDVFNEGRFLTRPQCVQLIVEAGYPYQAVFLEGVGPRGILGRMLRNLILIYTDRQEDTLARTLTRFLDVLYPLS
jgi:regulator of sirC expression with transglutaminase-like and TPR domain